MSSALTKNLSLVPVSSPSKPAPPSKSIKLTDRALISPWLWLAITCTFLLASGGIRFWRDRQYQNLAEASAKCPFPLADLPRTLGTWHAADGADSQLDPETARIAGSKDQQSLIRVYVDSKSGERADVLLLYGSADSVFAHSPDICFPASGFRPFGGSAFDRNMKTATSPTPAIFRTSYFTKTQDGSPQYWEVFCTFRHNGQWLNDLASRWKMFRAQPSMFKIQIQRQTSGLVTEDSPAQSLLKAIIEDVDRRLTPPPAAPPAKV